MNCATCLALVHSSMLCFTAILALTHRMLCFTAILALTRPHAAFPTGGVCDGGCCQPVRVPSPGHLPDVHRAAGHTAHALRLPAGLRAGEPRVHRLAVAPHLVCADRQGESTPSQVAHTWACERNRSICITMVMSYVFSKKHHVSASFLLQVFKPTFS